MDAARREPDYEIAGPNPIHAGENLVRLDHSHAVSGQIVLSRCVHRWHFGRFSTEQGTVCLPTTFSDAFYDESRRRNLQPTARYVVEEGKRFRTGTKHIVRTHCHQIDTDCVPTVECLGNLQLCSDTVRALDEHGVTVADLFSGSVLTKQSPETSEPSNNAGPVRSTGERLYPLYKRIAGIDIDAAGFV
ncbi:hypothetical protein ZHAS_00001249 [Anopheles sinensis]|uniref:Uncharacterized protein n=1 Tax=Anopheles sinensis TaxID=74873 RepID=A0A084WUZ5_ANOSI|nr:hypothetical protein ZHAS_00001249 [Anopheles sinensis]